MINYDLNLEIKIPEIINKRAKILYQRIGSPNTIAPRKNATTGIKQLILDRKVAPALLMIVK